jgi:hypothetical protein
MTTRTGGEEFDTEANPFNGKYLYLGRQGLSEHLTHLRNDVEAVKFLERTTANRVWRCYLGEVTEMDLTPPEGPRLIVREL